MQVRKILDDIETLPVYLTMPVEVRPDRRTMLRWMSSELNELSSKLPDAPFFQIFLEPAIRTATGVRHYNLPDAFPMNFVRLDANRWACNLDNGTSEANLSYVTPAEYYDRNLRGESNGVPGAYTIMTNPDGRRQIHLAPPPDANGSVGYYEIDGLYCPTDWDLEDSDSVPPIPNYHAILKYSILRRLNAGQYEPQYQLAMNYLMLDVARNRITQIKPQLDRGVYSRMSME